MRLPRLMALGLVACVMAGGYIWAQPGVQPFQLGGRIIDSSSKPLPGVEIRAVARSVLLAYTQSDGEGAFQIKIPPNDRNAYVTLLFDAPGYRASVLQYVSGADNQITPVMLRPSEVSNEEAGEIESATRRYIARFPKPVP